MAQMRGQGSYGIGAPNPFGGPSDVDKSDASPLDAIRAQTSKIEDLMDTLSEPLKPCVKPLLSFGSRGADYRTLDTFPPSDDFSLSSPSLRMRLE